MPSYKYYVVWNGREPGIYDNWNECAAQVNELSSNEYQGCHTLREALELWKKGSKESNQSIQDQVNFGSKSGESKEKPGTKTNVIDSKERKVLKKERFSSSSHTYFFEVKETSHGSNYIVIDQRRKVGEEFESNKMRIFEDELLEFDRILQKMIRSALQIS